MHQNRGIKSRQIVVFVVYLYNQKIPKNIFFKNFKKLCHHKYFSGFSKTEHSRLNQKSEKNKINFRIQISKMDNKSMSNFKIWIIDSPRKKPSFLEGWPPSQTPEL